MKKQPSVRVLMLIENSFYPQDPRVRRESLALVEAGHQVSVICPARGRQPLRETVGQVRVYRYPEPGPRGGIAGYVWEYAYSMMATLILSLEVHRREGFDVIHAANPPDTFALVAALYKPLGKRFVFDHHDLAPEMYQARFGTKGKGLVFRTLVLLEKLSCKLADHVIATNQSYRTVEMERGGVSPDRITVVRNGPDLDQFRAGTPDPALKEEGKKLIVFAGAMGPQDGVDYLLRALHHLIHDLGRTDFACVLVGGAGDARQGLELLVEELGLADWVRFTGWVSDEEWARYISSADICVDPDPSNPFTDRSTMMKIMEYMAAGKPTVAFDLPEHRYTAQSAATYVEPNDELAFARALADLMDDPERREAMGRDGRTRVDTELAWRYSVPHLLAAYEKLMAARAGKKHHRATDVPENFPRERKRNAA